MKKQLSFFIAFAVLCFGLIVVPAVVAQIAQPNCCTTLASSVVTSLNTLTGDVTISSPLGTLTIANSGQAIHVDTVPIPCPTAGSGVTITGTNLPACSFAASLSGTFAALDPLVYATPGGVNTYSCPTCIAGATASPIPAFNCIETNGSSKAHGAGGPCVILQSPTGAPESPSPQPGFVAVQYGITVNPQVNTGTPFPSPYPSIPAHLSMTLYDGGSQCEGQDYVDIGPSAHSVSGVVAQMLGGQCHNEPGTLGFAIDGHGNAAFAYLIVQGGGTTGGYELPDNGYIRFLGAAAGPTDCVIKNVQGSGQYAFTPQTTGTCLIEMGSVAASSPLCTNAGKQIDACATNIGVKGYSTTTTSPSSCAAFIQCGTVTFNFPTAYGAAPNCGAPGILDSTTVSDIWVGNIEAVSASTIVYNYATLNAVAAAKSLTFSFVCST